MNFSQPTSTPQNSLLPQSSDGATQTPPSVETKAPVNTQASITPGPKTPQDFLATSEARDDVEFPLSQAVRYQQPYREQYHFSPATGWLGDPDGMVRFNNLYHLFWWGHAESKDLVHWNERLSPMIGDNGSFVYYSGSVVVDRNNTSGLAADPSQPPMIAIYTMHDKATNKEQSIRIESSSGLSKDEVEKMRRDAQEHQSDDKKRKEEIDLRNQADSLVYSTEKQLKELKIRTDIQRTDCDGRARDRYASGGKTLLHDNPRSGPAGSPGDNAGARWRGLRP